MHALFRAAIDDLVQHAAEGELRPSPVTALEVAPEGAVDAAVRWARLTPELRRVRAVRAASERDGEALWELTHYVLATRGRLGENVPVLSKPFSAGELNAKVREALSGGSSKSL